MAIFKFKIVKTNLSNRAKYHNVYFTSVNTTDEAPMYFACESGYTTNEKLYSIFDSEYRLLRHAVPEREIDLNLGEKDSKKFWRRIK